MPAPGSVSGSITLYRAELYGVGPVPFGINPNDSWTVSLDDLRVQAAAAVRVEGHVPAQKPGESSG